MHIINLKQALNHGLALEKKFRDITFNQEAWLKPYIDINIELRKKAKYDFRKDVFNLMINVIFGKTMENLGKYRDINLITTKAEKNYLLSEPNHLTTIYFLKIYQQ